MEHPSLHSISEKLLPYLCLAVIVGYFAPYFIMGQSFPVVIHDNLDSTLIWSKLILENNQFFSYKNNQVPQMMNGNVQLSYSGDISFILFELFGMYWGYVANKIIMALVAFIGMLLLLKKHFVPGNQNTFLHYSIALIYSILPFWSFTLSVAGLPIALFAILNARRGQMQWYNWAILVVFAFYSSFVLSVFFFLTTVCIVWLLDIIRFRKVNIYFLGSIVLLSVSSIISHFPLFYSFMYPATDVSHRFEFTKENISLAQAIKSSIGIFKNGHYHSHSLHFWTFPAIILAIVCVRNQWKDQRAFFSILSFLIMSSLLYGFLTWGPIKMIFDKIMAIVPIQLQRFHFLHPLCWFLLFALALSIIAQKFKYGKLVATALIVIEFGFVCYHHEYIANRGKPSYAAFYAQDLFEQIKATIGMKPSEYRTISVGMHPSVAQYNGLYTLDAYIASYPLNYKHKFRQIIEAELNKDEQLKTYFDNWGSRCYAFSYELERKYVIGKDYQMHINHLDYNIEAFKKLGGKFIISSVPINSERNKNFLLKGIFSNDSSFYKIYLYEVP